MEPQPAKRTRAEQARINGARSKGPKTPAQGLFAVQNQTLPTEPQAAYDALRAEIRQYWQPAGAYEDLRVERLVKYEWDLRRLDEARHAQLLQTMEAVRRNTPGNTDPIDIHAQTIANAANPNSAVARLGLHIERLERAVARQEMALIRLNRHAKNTTGTQMSLITKGRTQAEPNEPNAAKVVDISQGHAIHSEESVLPPLPEIPKPDILTWAKQAVHFHPDPHQAELMTTDSREVLMLCGRQTGKSTAAAVRVAYEAVHFANETILLAGPAGRHAGHIMIKVRCILEKLGIELTKPQSGSEGFTLPNGTQVLALPENHRTIRGFSAPRLIVVDGAAHAANETITALKPMLATSNGALLLLSTPNGESGYFFETWRDENAPVTRIFLTSTECRRISQKVLANFARTMSRDEFDQEFNCKFVPKPGQIITREMFRKCLSPEVNIFLPELE